PHPDQPARKPAEDRHFSGNDHFGHGHGRPHGDPERKSRRTRRQREELRRELHRLNKSLVPIEDDFDVSGFKNALSDFDRLAREAAPERLQKLLRLTVRNVTWSARSSSMCRWPKAETG